MSSLSPRRRLSRLLAAFLGLFVCLVPAAVFALSREEAELTAAVAAPSPLSQEKDPSADYRAAAGRLAGLGLDQRQIDALWGRLGPELTARLDSGALSPADLDYLSLPYCRKELLERYQAYAQANPELSCEDVVTYVNIGLDKDFYTDVQEISESAGSAVLVNKYHALSPDYVPELVKLDSNYGSGSLTPEAADAFAQMADAARADGISLRSVSAYRSYSTQASLYQRYAAQSGRALADTFSARAGHSEHQTGLALDINVARTSAHFETTPEFAWLQEHCAQYGFLLRYPAEKTAITGYRFEPWHYRYVGAEIAQACVDQALTYDEYVARLPVPGDYQVPALFWQGEALDLGHGALLLDGVSYLSPSRLAAALGVPAQQQEEGLLLSDDQHSLTFLPGRFFQRDGLSLRLSHPALELDGELYVPLSDLCAALGLEPASTPQGLELSQGAPPQSAIVGELSLAPVI